MSESPVGSMVRAWREYRGMSLRALGVASGVHYLTIHALETGKHDIKLGVLQAVLEPLGLRCVVTLESL